ncbi:MAG TPA: hypothetical protein PK887_01990 [Ignavibacteriales bacterium]|nr:hypothetical protein [Ignavibacteriales bacterium]
MKSALFYLNLFAIFFIVQLSNFVTKLNEQTGDINFSIFFALAVTNFLLGFILSPQSNLEKTIKFLTILLFSSVLITIPVGYNYIIFVPQREIKIYLTINMVFKNILLFAFAYSGLIITELKKLKLKNYELTNELDKINSETMQNIKKAELHLYEAKLQANEMLENAKLELNNLKNGKKHIENEIKEFIKTQWEIIKNFEKSNSK